MGRRCEGGGHLRQTIAQAPIIRGCLSLHQKAHSNRIIDLSLPSHCFCISLERSRYVGIPNNSRCRISNKSQYQSAHGPHLRKPFRFTTAYLTVPQESKCRDFFTLFAAPVYHRSPLPIGEPSRCSTRIEMLPRFIHMKKKPKTCSCSWHCYC